MTLLGHVPRHPLQFENYPVSASVSFQLAHEQVLSGFKIIKVKSTLSRIPDWGTPPSNVSRFAVYPMAPVFEGRPYSHLGAVMHADNFAALTLASVV